MFKLHVFYRPTATAVLNHCYFWPKEKQLKFIHTVSTFLQPSNTDPQSNDRRQQIEENASDVIGDDWLAIIDKDFAKSKFMYA